MTGNTMQVQVFDIMLGIKAPFLFAGGEPSQFGIDIAHVRDNRRSLMIPDTQVKGVIRHAWTYLEGEGSRGPMAVEDAFGVEQQSDGSDRGRLVFTNLVAETSSTASRTTRVSIDDETGAAADGHLLVVEEVAKPGEIVQFHGQVRAILHSDEDSSGVADFLKLSMTCVVSMGRFKTVGYGELAEFRIEIVKQADLQVNPALTANSTIFEFSFGLDKSLLVDVSRPDSNTLVGQEVIPGGVLKGALANKLRSLGMDPVEGALKRVLSKLRISHANPVPVDQEEPKGTGTARRDSCVVQLGDDYQVWGPGFSMEPSSGGELCGFGPDWKWSPRDWLDRDVRTRVKIAQETGASEPGALFTQSAIWPEVNCKPISWRAQISWPGDPSDADYAIFLDCVECLRGGLFSVGKTNAMTTNLELCASSAQDVIASASKFAVLLKTHALFLRECHLADQRIYTRALQAYWTAVSDGLLTISREPDLPLKNIDGSLDFYCQQEMRADHLALRFRFFGEDVIEPFVLTRPGSVFRLETDHPDAAQARLM